MSVIITNKNKLRIITISNTKKKNAWNRKSYQEITDALNGAGCDESVSIVAITGAGDFYSSGNDMSDVMTRMGTENLEDQLSQSSKILYNMIEAFYNCKKPLVCVVNGPCIGIAATTAALCDVIYAAESAYFYTPFSLLGLVAEGCSSYVFPKILGTSKASEMLLFNHKMSSEEALKSGLVSEIFKSSELESKIWPRLENYSKLSQSSMMATKALIKRNELEILNRVNKEEGAALNERWTSGEAANAIVDFMQRKKETKSKL